MVKHDSEKMLPWDDKRIGASGDQRPQEQMIASFMYTPSISSVSRR
jgi:hypothetical protein